MATNAAKPNSAGVPSFDVDLHSDEALGGDPHAIYAQMRDAGPVVWLDAYGLYALPRFAEVQKALKDWETFNSGEGVGFNEFFNSIKTTSLQTHGGHHDEIRQVEARPLAPEELLKLKSTLREYAENLVAELRDRSIVDGVADVAAKMPMDVVTNLVGLDSVGRENLYKWGVEGFNSAGPMHADRTQRALEYMQSWPEYAQANIPQSIQPGGWADQLFTNGRKAGWSDELCRGVVSDYVYPSLDTTIHSTSTGLLLFGQNPEQWHKVRADRSLLTSSAILEIVRLASPIQYFTRLVTEDVEIGGASLPAGSRVLLMYGSANRDERQFPDPDVFDVERRPLQQVGWGGGKHACLGKPLARLEMITLFDVLADHFERFEVGDCAYGVNNIIRGLEHLELKLIRVQNK